MLNATQKAVPTLISPFLVLSCSLLFFSSGCTTDFGEKTKMDGGTDGAVCGNGVAETGEPCDGQDLKGLSCEDLGFSTGQLTCTPSCTLDHSDCIGSQQGVCSGTCVPCPMHAEKSSCGEVDGCQWVSAGCAGVCDDCTTMNGEAACSGQSGCFWTDKVCLGTCQSCSTLVGDDCSTQAGCTWSEQYCSGTPHQCDGRGEEECRDGCTWQSQGVCEGTGLKCIDITTQQACLEQGDACDWANGTCNFPAFPSDPPDCLLMTTADHCEDTGGRCHWNSSDPICRGTATNCATRTASTCRDGCTWHPETCSGTCSPCSNLVDETSCGSQAGCVWASSPSSTCTGQCTNCFDLSATSDSCNSQSGCAWIDSSHCEGACTPCDQLTDEASCSAQPECTWQAP